MDQIVAIADIADLEFRKVEKIERTLARIFSSSIAVNTYAQVIDGRPTSTSYRRECGCDNVTITTNYLLKPSVAAVKSYEAARAAFSVYLMQIDITVSSYVHVLTHPVFHQR